MSDDRQDQDGDEFSAQLRGGALGGGGGLAALAVAVGVVPFFVSFHVNDLQYVKLIGGGSAVALGLGSLAVGLYRRVSGRKGWGWLLGLVAMLLGVVHVMTSGVAGNFNLFGPADEDAIAALREEGLESIEITERTEDGAGFMFDSRRDGERCTGEIRISGSSRSLSLSCGILPIPDEELRASCADGAGESHACARLAARARESEPVDWVVATRAAQTACTAGAEHECFYVGVAYHGGDRGLEQDRTRAFEHFNRACVASPSVGTVACRNVASMMLDGVGTEQNQEGACDLLERGCADEDPQSCGTLGECFLRGEGRDRDLARARVVLEGACGDDIGSACTNLGAVHLDETPPDLEAALPAYHRSCELGSAIGCRVEAQLIADGAGDGPPQRGVDALDSLCEGDNGVACLELGLRLHDGREGIEADQARALQAFVRGCERSEPDCCRNVGVYYRDGLGQTSDPSQAGAYFQRACDAGLEGACDEARASR